ncbi:methyltransferase FkbM family [hydrothermal vent metagenome]|uniref:Methyltransferase FkbM family n=1 Tax=hydrothermal vent metagenome TaxID=652676 RepID=A0A1W1E4K4_9ZZZZ
MIDKNRGYGVGYQIMTTGEFDADEVQFVLALLRLRRQHFGNGVVAIDCGANFGVHSVEWGRLMHNWGHVWSFEAQEKIFYALAGNIIINNCLNVTARLAAVSDKEGYIKIAEPDYSIPSSFGSFELKKTDSTEFIGQEIDYSNPTQEVPLMPLDTLPITRLDLIKIDIEGMEEEALNGAIKLIQSHHPVLVIEIIKSNKDNIQTFLEEHGYQTFPFGLNVLAIHKEDPTLKSINLRGGQLSLTV